MQYDYDLLVIGAGSGGISTARRAAEYGVKVAICEQNALGGTCVNAGCIPKKLLVYAAEFADAFHDAKGYGWQEVSPEFHWQALLDNVLTEIKRINNNYQDLLKEAGINLLRGAVRLVAAHQIEINGKSVTARNIVIATGAQAWMPPIDGIDYAVDSDTMFQLKALPRRLTIIGGGYIASEFAGLMQRLAVHVTVIAKSPRLLMGFDADCAEACALQMQKNGIDLHLNSEAQAIQKQADGSFAVIINEQQQVHADLVLVAAGRKANTQGLNLEGLNMQLDEQGYIHVDQQFATSIQGIYALGDVTGGMQLTPVAIAQGHALAGMLFKDRPSDINLDLAPTTVFANPPVAKVGLTEQQARDKGLDVAVFTKSFKGLKVLLTDKNNSNFLKLVVDRQTDRVIGAHMAGDDAGEIMQGIAIAMQAGAKKADFDRTIGIHPTAAEEFVSLRDTDSA
ncbi:MAG: glutathione-disulfide reductase [Methylophaga sp.]|nr:glutathione-disulfide reductase [Methylophaga sp.]